MSDHNININFGGDNPQQGGNYGFLSDVLNKLNANLAKLENAIQKLNTSSQKTENINTKSTLEQRTQAQKELIELRAQKKLQEQDKKYQQEKQRDEERHNRRLQLEKRREEQRIAISRRSFGLGALGGIGYTALQYLANQNSATMSKAGATGSFLGANIQGTGANNYGNYVGSLYNIEKNRQIARNNILAQGAGSLAFGTAGFFMSGFNPVVAGASAYAGNELGKSLMTPSNAGIEQRIAIQRAISERMANASIAQNRTGFSRFGLSTSLYDIVPRDFTGDGKGIQARLSSEFENMYGMRNGLPNTNYNAIMGITPYLQSSPTDKGKTGDLNKVIDNFTKAGFAVQDFTKLAVQGSLYQSLTGKNLQSFSNSIYQARVKFGETFGLDTAQTSLNLMSLGYNENNARNIAFQSQYNSGMMSNVERFQHQGVGDWYRNKIIGDMYGIDINKSLQTGTFQGSASGRKQLMSARNSLMNGGQPLNNPIYTMLNASGVGDLGFISSLLQSPVKTLANPDYTPSKNSPERQTYENNLKGMIESGIINTDQMTVNASVVNVNSDGFFNSSQSMMQSYFAPNPQGGSYDPSKK